jgi:hypothetical protein
VGPDWLLAMSAPDDEQDGVYSRRAGPPRVMMLSPAGAPCNCSGDVLKDVFEGVEEGGLVQAGCNKSICGTRHDKALTAHGSKLKRWRSFTCPCVLVVFVVVFVAVGSAQKCGVNPVS